MCSRASRDHSEQGVGPIRHSQNPLRHWVLFPDLWEPREAQAAINALNDPERFMASAEKVLRQVGSELRLGVAAATTHSGLQKGITFVKVASILGLADVPPTDPTDPTDRVVTAAWANRGGGDD
jgi:hypothetical protein